MEGFTIVDGGVLFVLLISAMLAYSRGFVREILSIAGWIAAAIAAFMFAPDVYPLIAEIPVVGDVLGTNCSLSILAAFGIVFVAALIVVSIFTPLISGAIQNSALGPLDRGMGFLFGIARGVLLVVVALVVYDLLVAGGQGIELVDQSRTAEIFADAQGDVMDDLPTDAPDWIEARWAELNAVCTGEAPAQEPADPPQGQTIDG